MLKLLRKLLPQNVDMLIFYYPSTFIELDLPQVDGFHLVRDQNEFQIKNGSRLIHRSRIFTKSNLLSNFCFTSPFITIGDCLTEEEYKGRGIYPKVIQFIANHYINDHQVYILVSPNNTASIKGIEKAGFNFMARLKGMRLLFFYINKKISTQRN